ncbi:hypothetical protein AAG94_01340 [Escherichia albertii]|nr:hypothetical protein [Escherichia albertii]EFB7456714.1 hypothetical protein [Escherichia albertii]EFO4717251.1 hypothetical protein [Escherichia albertii]KAF0950684.1 hypothetical protein AQU20_07195 [Escherichia albertii]PFF96253.1 hypothetical protein CRH02_08610 [Escherichia albertii]
MGSACQKSNNKQIVWQIHVHTRERCLHLFISIINIRQGNNIHTELNKNQNATEDNASKYNPVGSKNTIASCGNIPHIPVFRHPERLKERTRTINSNNRYPPTISSVRKKW